jgi:hypothetical protein
MAEVIPLRMSKPMALAHIRDLAADSNKIVVIAHGRQRQNERTITRRQIEECVRAGYIAEGPFLNDFGNWQVTMEAYSAGEELTCVVAIEWATRLLVITVY